mmetsp:Transcript_25104/g.58535  ORF Transcript_25104/g.58535 Transcript_25104/m.58535 type:complete len:240 (+) Transcript_25104:91-810(+)
MAACRPLPPSPASPKWLRQRLNLPLSLRRLEHFDCGRRCGGCLRGCRPPLVLLGARIQRRCWLCPALVLALVRHDLHCSRSRRSRCLRRHISCRRLRHRSIGIRRRSKSGTGTRSTIDGGSGSSSSGRSRGRRSCKKRGSSCALVAQPSFEPRDVRRHHPEGLRLGRVRLSLTGILPRRNVLDLEPFDAADLLLGPRLEVGVVWNASHHIEPERRVVLDLHLDVRLRVDLRRDVVSHLL